MYYPAKLEFQSYVPEQYTKNVLFKVINDANTRFETVVLTPLEKLVGSFILTRENIDDVVNQYGYPVQPYIVDYDGVILATPDQIGWWDDGEDTDELYDITVRELNGVINKFDGDISIEVYDFTEPNEPVSVVTYVDKVILSYPFDEEDVDTQSFVTNREAWFSGKVISTIRTHDDKNQHLVEYNNDYYIIFTDLENQLLHPDYSADLAPETQI
jgi:hypothetical protein